MAKQPSEQLEVGVPSNDSINAAEDNADVRAAYMAAGHVTDGLETFQLKPPSKKGHDLLDHMHAFALRDPKSQYRKQDGRDDTVNMVEPSSHLDLALSDSQYNIILKASNRNLTMHELMKDAGGQGATLKIAKHKLNSLATIQSHSGMANDKRQLHVLKNKYKLTASLAEIDRQDKADQQAKKNPALMEKRTKARDAIAKLAAKGGKVSKLMKLEIVAIVFVYFNKDEKENTHKKEYLANLLQGCIQTHPGNLGQKIWNEVVTPVAPSNINEESNAKHEGVHPGHTHDHTFSEE
jgi:hypothetical protein